MNYYLNIINTHFPCDSAGVEEIDTIFGLTDIVQRK